MSENRVREREKEREKKKKERSLITSVSCESNRLTKEWIKDRASEINTIIEKYIFQTINIKSNSKSNRIIIGQQQQQQQNYD